MKKLPVGIDDYKKIIEEGYAYVDKTLFIQEIIERGTELALILVLVDSGRQLTCPC